MAHSAGSSGRLAGLLKRAGLSGLAADVLESLGPLTSLGAQFLYLLEPLAGGSEGTVGGLARMLDDPEELEGVVDLLRREATET